ncbi:reverse transcriptase domain-containing protein [Tanacetum coccineum]
MRTRNAYFPNNSNVTILRRRNRNRVPKIVKAELRTIIAPMKERTMEELLREPTEGYGEAIVLPEINADHFEIKTNLLQLVQANPFYGCESENPHAQINSFKRITSTLLFRNVPNDVIKLMMFPYSLEGASKTCEAWERFKELLRACPHRGFTELTQVDTFYNGLNENEQDSLNAAAGGNLLSKTTREALNIIENKSKVCYSRNRSNVSRMNATSSKTDERIDKLTDQLSTLVEIVSKKVVVTPAPVKAVEELCVTCGGAHSWKFLSKSSLNFRVERETEESTDEEQSNLQGSTAQIPPPITPIPIPEPDVPKTLTKSNPIPEPDVTKNLPKPNIPYPSKQNNQKNHEKSSYQKEKIIQMFQDLSFDISFADALFLMPRFAPTIRNLLTNKEKLLELVKNPLSENCSAMLLKKLPEKLGDPGKFLIPYEFPRMEICHALADPGASINLMPFSIWKKLSLPDLTPTRMTLELADRSITRPKGLAEDVFVKVGKFHFPTDFVIVDFEAGPRVPLILGRSFLRTSRTLIDVYEEELILRDGNKQIVFHVDGVSKHPQKHANESIKLVNDTCKDGFDETNNFLSGSTTSLSNPNLESFETNKSLHEKTTDEPTPVCSPPPGDDDNEKKKQEKESIFSDKTPQVSLVFTITSIEPKDSLIMGDEHFSTSRVEEIVPIPRKSEDSLNNDKGSDLTSCDDNMIFSNLLFNSKDDLTSSNDDSILKEDIQEEDFRIYSNPLFEFGDNFNSSNENPLFNEMEEDVENENSKVFDEPVLPHTPFSDKVECFDPGDDIDEIDAFLAMEISFNFEEGYYDSEGDILYLESLLCDDTIHNPSPEVFSDHEPQNESNHETLITFSPKSDPLHHEFAGEIITLPSRIAREHEEYLNHMISNIESLPTSPIPVEDSDLDQEEIDIFTSTDDIMPPGIENTDYDLEGDIRFLEELPNNNLIPLPEHESPNLDHQDNPSTPQPPPEPPDVEIRFEPDTAMTKQL